MTIEKNYVWRDENKYIYIEILYEVDGYFTYYVRIRNFDFSGANTFCVDQTELENMIQQIKKMSNNLSGCVDFRDIDSDSFLHFAFEGNRIRVNGQLGASWNEEYLVFAFFVDQTILNRILDVFYDYII